MTFLVFIAYGGDRAKRIAEKLGLYLEKTGINTFVASTHPRWMIYGYPIERVLQKLKQSELMVLVCTEETQYSAKVQKEVNYARNNRIPIIPFVEEGLTVPFNLGRIYWKCEFKSDCPWRKHREIALYILHLVEQRMETIPQARTPVVKVESA